VLVNNMHIGILIDLFHIQLCFFLLFTQTTLCPSVFIPQSTHFEYFSNKIASLTKQAIEQWIYYMTYHRKTASVLTLIDLMFD